MANTPQQQGITVRGVSDLITQVEDKAGTSAPFLLAVAGPPGAGKSTLAAQLQKTIARPACVIPMDGFHLNNATLKKRGLLQRKGAPETFDLAGFLRLVTDLRHQTGYRFPTFDRAADCVIPDGGTVPAGTEVLIFEGNYLLFDEPGWADLRTKWDASVWLDVPNHVLEDRLIQRWRDHGLSEDDALARARENDLPNADRICGNRLEPTWIMPDPGASG